MLSARGQRGHVRSEHVVARKGAEQGGRGYWLVLPDAQVFQDYALRILPFGRIRPRKGVNCMLHRIYFLWSNKFDQTL